MEEKPVKVLVVEDSPTDALLLREALTDERSMQFRTAHAETLADALRTLQEQPFDLILLDLGLPDSQGLDTLARTHASLKHRVRPRRPVASARAFLSSAQNHAKTLGAGAIPCRLLGAKTT